MTATTPTPTPSTPSTLGRGDLVPAAPDRRLAAVCVVAALMGALSAAAMLAWPPMVAEDRFSYPFDAAWHIVFQLFFAVQHLGLLAGIVALGHESRRRPGRATRAGVVVAAVGMVVLTAAELLSVAAARSEAGSARADLAEGAYGPAMILIGIGFLVAGVGVARGRLLPGWGRWVPLALGGYVFVVLFPAVFGPMVLGRLAIGAWMLGFAALGVALHRTIPAAR